MRFPMQPRHTLHSARNEVSRVRRSFSLLLEHLEGRALLSGNTPTVAWANPADITYGIPLGAAARRDGHLRWNERHRYLHL